MASLNCATLDARYGHKTWAYAPAQPLSAAAEYLQQNPAVKFHALAPYFVRQETDCSCSVASTAVILNAALAQRRRRTLTQAEVVASDTSGLWAQATADGPNCPGVDLGGLALYMMRSFYTAGLKNVAVDVHQVSADSQEVRDMLRHKLTLSEQSAADQYIVVNYLQKTLVGAGDAVGHMSVVAAYDGKKDRVLVYDVDNRAFEPYWVKLSQLMAGMHTRDDQTAEPRGYLVVRLNR
jgi:hypothetical protein